MNKSINIKYLAILILGCGIFLRINHYLDNLSLWGDEAWLAIDLTRRSLTDILLNVNLNPHISIPPVGYLGIEKILINLLGASEYVFRSFSLFCAIASLLLFRKLLNNIFSQKAALIALGFFAFSNPLIFHSAELKQYSSDALITIILYIVSFSCLLKTLSPIRVIFLSLLGLMSILLSHPSIFILGGVSLAQTTILLKDKNIKLLKQHIIIYVFWLLSFLLIFGIYYNSNFKNPRLIGYQSAYFLSFENVSLWFSKFYEIFNNPVGISLKWVAFPIFCIGVFSLFKDNYKIALQLTLALILTICASFAQKYPLTGRFLTFLVPLIIIFITQGLCFIFNFKPHGRIVAGLLFLALISQPLIIAGKHIVQPRYIAEIRPLLSYLKSHQQKGDALYLNNTAQYAFNFYTNQLKFPFVPKRLGVLSDKLREDDSGKFIYLLHARPHVDSKVYSWNRLLPGGIYPGVNNFTRIEGKRRTWILFSQITKDAQKHFLSCLNEAGNIVLEEKSFQASLYLYNLD